MPSPQISGGGSYDVAVLGGGPAGAATALALRRRDAGVRVALVEKSDYSAFRVGETLPPPVRRLLERLGVWDAFPACGAAESYGTRAAWGSAAVQENAFIFSPYGRGWHVDRRNFDAWLAGEAQRAGADVYRGATARATGRRGGGWTVTLLEEGVAHREIHARVVVDANGRHSPVARGQGARQIVFDGLVGVAVRVRDAREHPLLDSYTMVEACPDGWWYTAILPDGHLLAIFMTDADLLRRTPWRRPDDMRALAACAPLTAERMACGTAAGEPAIYPAASQRLDTCAGDGWFAVGDAAGTVDPLSSQGVMRALRSGINAARVIQQHASGDRHALLAHDVRLANEYDAYLDTRFAYYAMEQRWPDSPFWRRRHTPVRGRGAAHAVRLENQHHEESQEGPARHLHVRGDAAGEGGRRDLLEQQRHGGPLAGPGGEERRVHGEPDRGQVDLAGLRAGTGRHHQLHLLAP
jgi:flavin-dependent dehydrogenase